MSTNDFLKGECSQCAGHLEYPASAGGETIVCPHCGWQTELPAPPAPPVASNSRRWLIVSTALLLLVSAVLAGALMVFKKTLPLASSHQPKKLSRPTFRWQKW